VQAAHPTFARTVGELRDAGVTVLLGPDGYEPYVPHTGSRNLPRCLDARSTRCPNRVEQDLGWGGTE
jgi:hypothetical protein